MSASEPHLRWSPISIVVTLALFVVAMGLDGLNSTLDDVGLITIYQPLNEMRYITGALTGTAGIPSRGPRSSPPIIK